MSATSEPTASPQRVRAVVAIDGPAGVGKSSAAQRLAQRLGYVLVDTGALYRGVALSAREAGVSWDDGAALGRLAAGLDFTFTMDATGVPRLHVAGIDRESDIRNPAIARGASDVSRHPEVRAALLGLQRKLGEGGGVVLEGRDIGTVVFPDAELKVFLTASAEERARRRVGDMKQRGQEVDFQEILRSIEARDAQDSSRAVAPLKPAEDAVLLETSCMNLEQVVAHLVELVRDATSTHE
ncbi:MAG: (d)CMP kinase [Deltaproteobacteria bacterium]|nr:(d)CMP kinase [Deltaproteobacteria bacterium]